MIYHLGMAVEQGHGVCAIDVNGKPRLACRARVKDGDIISPLSTPVIKKI